MYTIGACKRAWRCHYVALALSWTVSYASGANTIVLRPNQLPVISMRLLAVPYSRYTAPEGTAQLRHNVAYIYIQWLRTSYL